MARSTRLALFAIATSATIACSSHDLAHAPAAAAASSAPKASTVYAPPNFYAGPVDDSQSVVTHKPIVETAYAFVSVPLRDAIEVPPPRHLEIEPRKNPFPFANATAPDPVVQLFRPVPEMPTIGIKFLDQGTQTGGCVYPKPDGGEPSTCTTTGDPPDTNGAVGPNHYVQTVNGGISVYTKAGTQVMAPKLLKALLAGYTGTNTGNGCATNNDGDPVVLYDQMADRWFVTQFSLPGIDTNTPPAFQCVAVSQTGDPTGAYYLYDFQYDVPINDYGKFGVWPDAYYASFNNFPAAGQPYADVCAYDRASMLKGLPATQQCFAKNGQFGLLPGSLDGPIPPPKGTPEFLVSLNSGNSLGLWKFHVDWTTPANSTLTGPTGITVASYTQLCNGGSCIPQPGTNNQLASLADRPMFHLSYRNFGDFDSLVFNHSVSASNGGGGARWYEIRSPNGTPVVQQQSTYAPDNGYRWMGSINQDMANDLALGYSLSSSSLQPAITWTGHLNTDTAGTMGQAEAIVVNGNGVETGNFSNNMPADRWGDYSNMAIDPSDDCTFWYTQEFHDSGDGIFNWDTEVASVKFPNCGANDFSITAMPAMNSVPPGGMATYTIATTKTAGNVAETIKLAIQDLPTGVTAAFNPATIMIGQSTTLTLTAAANAPLFGATPFTVIGHATSAVHAATAKVSVGNCVPLTQCPSPQNCGTISDGCGGTITCTPNNCTAPQTCGGGGAANVCGCTPTTTCASIGAQCGTYTDDCNVVETCNNTCTADQVCANNICMTAPPDMAHGTGGTGGGGGGGSGGRDLGTPVGSDDMQGGGGIGADMSSGGGKGGCSCRIGGERDATAPWAAAVVVLALGLALIRRRIYRAHF